MSSLSVVVPRVGTDPDFESTLASALRYRLARHQVVAVQHSRQERYDLDGEVDFVDVADGANGARCLNAALPFLTGEAVAVVFPGVDLVHHWFAAGIRSLQQHGAGCVAVPLRGRVDGTEIRTSGVRTSRRMVPRHAVADGGRPVGPVHLAGFWPRHVLEKILPADESLSDHCLGLDLGLKLSALGYCCELATGLELPVVDDRLPLFRPASRYAHDAQRLVDRHGPLAGPSVFRRLAAAAGLTAARVWPGRRSTVTECAPAESSGGNSADRTARQAAGTGNEDDAPKTRRGSRRRAA